MNKNKIRQLADELAAKNIAIRQAKGNVLFQAGFVLTIQEQNAERKRVLKIKL